MKSLSVKTFAKINLCIDVLGKREDGYHEVAMVMHQVNLFDRIVVRVEQESEENGTSKIILKTNRHYIPVDERNTAYQAALLMLNRYLEMGGAPVQIRIDIQKNIPVAAGLAGGSSNAAGVILALNRIWNMKLSLQELMEIGAMIGSDVPFCIMGQAKAQKFLQVKGGAVCALATGRGTALKPLPSLDLWILLAKPPISVSTAAVYKQLNLKELTEKPNVNQMIDGINKGDFEKIRNNMINVLETVTFIQYPDVKKVKDLMATGVRGAVLMSGSGPTIFAIYKNKSDGESMRRNMAELYKEVFLVKTLTSGRSERLDINPKGI